MSNCGITSIEEFAFDQLRYLGELVLNYNLLTELPQLKKTMVFVTITAKGNMISKVSPNLFPIGSLIRNIDLSHNLLSDVETANSVVLKELPVLEKLDLSDNGISSLDVIQLKSAPVKQLGLEQNQLYSPLDFSKFTSLYLLNLASNSISELPIFPESLEILSLNNNQLNGSKLVFPALNLKEVYLSGNRFEALNSMAFINLANVSVITLLDNGLASYDLQLKKIANVRVDEKVALTINGINMTPHVPRVVYQRLLDLQNALTFEDSTDSA
uniref:Leucine-rich repeat-containing protein 15-like n=2 Tax=Panagrellus redivivus TaxID=6233 RepID=A0A7E5A0R0_PANRE